MVPLLAFPGAVWAWPPTGNSRVWKAEIDGSLEQAG